MKKNSGTERPTLTDSNAKAIHELRHAETGFVEKDREKSLLSG